MLYFSLLSIIFQISTAQIYGNNNYTVFYSGNVNILISIPHDGPLLPSDITNRTSDSAGNLVTDYNTRKLGLFLRDELAKLLGKTPFAVVNNLHRIKMDPNRSQNECCVYKNETSFTAYTDYHNFISKNFEEDFMEASLSYKQGLLIDIHGQSHAENWTEIGYLLSSSQLNSNQLDSKQSSIRLLASKTSTKFESVIKGPNESLGGILQNKFNLKVVPSPNFPGPSAGNYYSGGYITKTYGSSDCKSSRVNAIQIESPYYLRTNSNVADTAKKFASAIYEYYSLYNFDERSTNTSDNLLMLFLCLNHNS